MSTRNDLRSMPERYRELHEELTGFIPDERIVLDPLRRLAYGTDGSFYRLVPQMVLRLRTAEEVSALLRAAARHETPVTFRAAGTSLSGQAVSDSVLATLTGGWRKHRISDRGERISLEPGVVGGDANALLAPFGRKLGPDPASIGAAMIGGIVANNASGMCCGTAQNSYRTVESMKLVLADGTFLDTADPESRRAFAESHAELLDGLAAIRDELARDPVLKRRVAEKYRIKNTTGYGLNAFVDFDDPFDILLHLLVGSEGTLAFIAEVTYRTVVDEPHRASTLALFRDIGDAARATQLIQGGVVSAAEMMDRASLRSVEDKPGMPPGLKALPEDAAALLIEVRAPSAEELPGRVAAALERMASVPTLAPVEFTAVKAEYERLWDIRRGLFPAVGGARPAGTTVVIEDVAFPIRHMAEATVELRKLMQSHGYDGIIFGHALDGNLHFVFTPDFARPGEVERYAKFMDDVCTMVAQRFDGSLKAEHGTGRNVAPFVALEWGDKAYGFMRRVKDLFDPRGLLNPGVIIVDDPQAHLKNLKSLPRAHAVVDKCIECGFCEPKCPSREVTLTPRQRIVSQREIARLRTTGDDAGLLERFLEDYDYLGEATCAACGLCATACPVGIDVAEHTKGLRAEKNREAGSGAATVAEHFGATLSGARAVLGMASAAHAVLGTTALSAISRGLHVASFGKLPVWNEHLPRPVSPRLTGTSTGSDLKVVYFPSCVARTMGPSRADQDGVPVYQAMLSLLAKARCDVAFPDAMENLCCGQPFESKGFPVEADRKTRELEERLLEISEGGKLPILFDTSPCAYRMRKHGDQRLKIYDPVEFIEKFLLDRLELTKIPGPVALHVPCSATKAGLGERFKKVASACSEQVIVPARVGCCGFAGDRGFNYPELNASALAPLADAIPDSCESGWSSSRTCEIGLSMHAGIPYRSLAVLVDRCAAPRRAHLPQEAAR